MKVRPSRERNRIGVASLLSVYLGAVALIIALPTPVDQPLRPFIYRWLWRAHRAGLPEWFTYGEVEWGANVVLFIPIGVLVVALAGRARWWAGAAFGVALSCAAELTQAALLPDRVATWTDVAANSAGALLGSVICSAALTIATQRRASPGARSDPPEGA